MRWLAVVAGAALLVLAFAAAARVSDTREGLIAEVITLLAGGAGFVLLIFGLAARDRPEKQPQSSAGVAEHEPARGPRSSRDLILGGAGIVLALILLSGLGFSGGPLWAGLGLALLLPMLAGSVYLCVRYLRASP